MNRRHVLIAFGAVSGGGLLGRYALLPPPRSRKLDTAQDLAIRFLDSLDAQDRKRACMEYDHPIRQYHNRGVWGAGLPANPLNLNWEQRKIVTDLLYAGLSEAGQERVPNEFFTKWPGVHSMNVVLCGNPKTPPYQLILTGAHLNLRVGGRSREGTAFGGPLVYGDQRGNGVQGVPGNLYRFQFQIAYRLFLSLRSDQQRLALRKASPIQTAIQLQGSQGSFEGMKIAALSKEGRTLARELVDGILCTYPAEDVAYAQRCLEQNGGVENLFLSYYEDSEVDRSKQYQNFRLEGPAAVFYFRGFPHVHAFVNVEREGDAPLSVGESLGDNPAVLEGAKVKQLFEAALLEYAQSDLSYYPLDSVAGRLRRGTIRSGDIYALESWQDSVATIEIKGSNLTASFVEELRRRGIDPDRRRVYSIATTAYLANAEGAEGLGRIEARHKGGTVRDALIDYVKKRGFVAAG